jgi:type II secretory pathway pseudopilin PulG
VRLNAFTSRRAGTTLVELLIALPLLALVGAIALMLLLSAQRATQHADRLLANTHELRQASAVLESELRSVAATDLIAWSDTSIDLQSTIGAGIACNGRGTRDRVDLLPERSTDPLRTAWSATAQPDDELRVYLNASSATDPRAFRASIRSLAYGRACAGSPLVDSSADPSAQTRTVMLRDPLPASLLAGYPVRIVRLVRYALYQSGGEWFLGRRERSATGWDVVQPFAGPLLPPAAGGLRLQVRDANAAPIAPGDTTARLIHLELRSPARSVAGPNATRRSAIDSAVIDITLRAALETGAGADSATHS